MSLFHSDNEKEKKHSGILGAFSVDNIKGSVRPRLT